MEKQVASPYRLPLLSGLLLGVSYYAPVLVFNLIAFIPLLYWLDHRPNITSWQALRAGMLVGLPAHLFTTHFLLALTEFSMLAVLLYLFVAAALAVKLALGLWLLTRLRLRTGWSWTALLLIVWIPLEWITTFSDLRLTADHLYHGMTPYPFLIQFADLIGPFGITAVVITINTWLYAGLVRRDRAALVRLALLCVTVLAYDTAAWLRPEPEGKTVRVGLVQPNIPLLVKRGEGSEQLQWNKLVDLTTRAAQDGAELVVWPETARPWVLYHWLDRDDPPRIPETETLARELGIEIAVGVEYARVKSREDYELYNAAMIVGSDGVLGEDWTAKLYLVPFTEQTPFKSLFGQFIEGKGGEWRWLSGGFTPPAAPTLLETEAGPVGVLVCYEQLFSDLAREISREGAQVQLVITNDAWFGRTWFQKFQADAVRLRAIENRSWIVRAANTGISGFADSKGRFYDATPLYTEEYAVRDVKFFSVVTVYNRIGDVVVYVALAGLAAALLIGRSRRNHR